MVNGDTTQLARYGLVSSFLHTVIEVWRVGEFELYTLNFEREKGMVDAKALPMVFN